MSHLAWSPFSRLLAGAYADGRMLLWDVDKAQSVSEVSAEPPGVVFVHGGHSGCEPTGLAWSNDCPQLMASADSNEIQFWRPAATLFGQGSLRFPHPTTQLVVDGCVLTELDLRDLVLMCTDDMACKTILKLQGVSCPSGVG